MDKNKRAAVDAEIKALLANEDYDAAAEAVVRHFGGSILGMYNGVFHNEALAQDTFQFFSIQLWQALPSFKSESAVFTWVYTIARRCIGKVRRKVNLKEVALETQDRNNLVAKWTRTATAEWRNTATKDRFKEVCQDLDEHERTLVMLRIGEELSWKEIARIVSDDETLADPSKLRAASATLRKRFERVKTKLAKAMNQ